MRVLTFVSAGSKAGKTTLATHIAACAERAGFGSAAVIRMDGAPIVAARCGRFGPAIIDCSEDSLAEKLDELRCAGISLAVIDTPSTLSSVTEAALTASDLVLIPVRVGKSALAALDETLALVEGSGQPFVFVINAADTTTTATATTAMTLAQYGAVCLVTIRRHANFVDCAKAGETVFDNRGDSAAAADIEAFWDYLSQRLAKVASVPITARTTATSNRRKYPRWEYGIPGRLTVDGEASDCRLNDISAGGLSVFTEQAVFIGDRVTLSVAGLGGFEAEVRNVVDGRIGLQFVISAENHWQMVQAVSDVVEGTEQDRRLIG